MTVISDIGGTSNDSFTINGKVTLFQGDDIPEEKLGKNGDIYFQSNGIMWSKSQDEWHNMASVSLPDAALGPNKLLYSNGSYYTFANAQVDNNGKLIVDEISIDKPGPSASKTSTDVPTIGWVNDPTTATNVVHRSGDETINDKKTFTSGLKVSSLGSLPAQYIAQSQDYGFMIRNDNINTYFLLTNQGDKDGNWNSLKPMFINNETGNVSCRTQWTFTKTIQGTAYRAFWGDLAEYYNADAYYPEGTLMTFGGDNEVTVAKEDCNAVVSSNPGVILNSGDDFEYPCKLALVGRVPVRVIGKVNKFDYLKLSDIPGVAIVSSDDEFPMSNVIARALESKDTEEEGLVICVVKFEL